MTHDGAHPTVNAPAGITPEPDAVFCDLSAIPANERDAHFGLARSLLFADERAVREVENGLLFELPAERLGDVARFIENERRCCRHLAFGLEVPPRGGRMTLRVTGPGARQELRALGVGSGSR